MKTFRFITLNDLFKESDRIATATRVQNVYKNKITGKEKRGTITPKSYFNWPSDEMPRLFWFPFLWTFDRIEYLK